MVADPKFVLHPDAVDQFREFIALEFNQRTALRAIQMVVLRIAVVMLVDGSTI